MEMKEQPGQVVVQWAQLPASIPGCPPGLEYLTTIDQVVVKQLVELLETFTGCETKNKYRVFNSVGQQIFFAQETTDCMMRICCGPNRGFQISVTDNNQQPVMSIIREFKCFAGCCWCANTDCCAWVVRVEAPVGTPVGYVRQECSSWKPNFSLYTMDDEPLGRIHGPCCVCHCPCCGDVEFPVMDPGDTTEIGMINKTWSGVFKEMFTNAETFGVRFPVDMDVKMKAVMIGALFLIDLMYFESK